MNWLRRLFRSRSPGRNDLQDALADWRIVTAGTPSQGSVVLRIRIEKPRVDRISTFATAVAIGWPYEPTDDMPPPEVNRQQVEFEQAVDELTCENQFSELVRVSTGMGVKEWLFYTTCKDRFMATLNVLLAGHEPYPLDIKFYDDRQWRIWSDTLSDIQQRGDLA